MTWIKVTIILWCHYDPVALVQNEDYSVAASVDEGCVIIRV